MKKAFTAIYANPQMAYFIEQVLTFFVLGQKNLTKFFTPRRKDTSGVFFV